jgi:hypothetical protein
LTRKFEAADCEAMLGETVSIKECLSPNHLARFVVKAIVDAINPIVGKAKRVALDAGYFSATNIEGFQFQTVTPTRIEESYFSDRLLAALKRNQEAIASNDKAIQLKPLVSRGAPFPNN